jgi:hypothetical protein
MITYQVENFSDNDDSVEVTYTNENNQQHKRILNIPKNSDGTLNETYWKEILEGQLRGVQRKYEVGAISFNDIETNQDSVNIEESENLDSEEPSIK